MYTDCIELLLFLICCKLMNQRIYICVDNERVFFLLVISPSSLVNLRLIVIHPRYFAIINVPFLCPAAFFHQELLKFPATLPQDLSCDQL